MKKLYITVGVILLAGLIFATPILAKGKANGHNRIPVINTKGGQAILVPEKAAEKSPVLEPASFVVKVGDAIFFILTQDDSTDQEISDILTKELQVSGGDAEVEVITYDSFFLLNVEGAIAGEVEKFLRDIYFNVYYMRGSAYSFAW